MIASCGDIFGFCDAAMAKADLVFVCWASAIVATRCRTLLGIASLVPANCAYRNRRTIDVYGCLSAVAIRSLAVLWSTCASVGCRSRSPGFRRQHSRLCATACILTRHQNGSVGDRAPDAGQCEQPGCKYDPVLSEFAQVHRSPTVEGCVVCGRLRPLCRGHGRRRDWDWLGSGCQRGGVSTRANHAISTFSGG